MNMPLTFWLATLLGAGLVFVRVLSQVALWQRKEYRWDRLASVLLTQESRTLITWPVLASMLVLDAAWIAVLKGRLEIADVGGWAALLFIGIQVLYWTYQRGVARPDTTAKAILIITASVLLILVYLRYSFIPAGVVALQWATLLIFTPLLVAVAVGLVTAPVALRKRDIIAKAARHRRTLKHLTVVGITGSFGKTSTKYFLQQLLAARPHVAVTLKHRNSALAVAQDMLQQLSPDTSIYVAEMGAYRRGEIAELAALTLPRLGVITAIGNQHLSLFGSQETIAAAKWELIDALPSGGTAILNYDDPRLRKKAHSIPQKIVWFSVQKARSNQTLPAHSVFVDSVKIAATHITCILHSAGKNFPLEMPLASEALLSSAVAAAATALSLGLSPAEIVTGLAQLKPFPRTMELRTNSSGTVIIDDSYSANEQGVCLAVEHLARFKEAHKIIVLTPLIELGDLAPQVHEKIGAVLARSNATVIVYGSTYIRQLRRGGSASQPDFNLETIPNPRLLQERLVPLLKPDTVLLLEGRLPNVVRERLLQ